MTRPQPSLWNWSDIWSRVGWGALEVLAGSLPTIVGNVPPAYVPLLTTVAALLKNLVMQHYLTVKYRARPAPPPHG